MGKIKFELEPGEQKVGKWTIHCLSPAGGKFAGKLLVTDRRILFEPLNPKQDLSLAAAIDALPVDGVVSAGNGRTYWEGGGLRIPRVDVRSIAQRRTGTMKQVVLTLVDGQEVVFDNGFLSVDKLVTALGG
jgi:hypothetical protein